MQGEYPVALKSKSESETRGEHMYKRFIIRGIDCFTATIIGCSISSTD